MEKYIITIGSGNSKYGLNAFDKALLASGIGDYNLVKLSSILPPHASRVEAVKLPRGSILHTAYSSYIEHCPGKTICAAIAVAKPKDESLPGVIMEVSGEFRDEIGEEIVTSMARISMESRSINEYDIQKEFISMITQEGSNCVIAAVSIW